MLQLLDESSRVAPYKTYVTISGNTITVDTTNAGLKPGFRTM
jgi:hypothetical protein